MEIQQFESPDTVRLSLAAAMTLGFRPGEFYRGANLGCLNILLSYEGGCLANCQYCGLARERKIGRSGRSFIRVAWPAYPLGDVIRALVERDHGFRRICVSMVTRRQAVDDCITVIRSIRSHVETPVSALVSPSVMEAQDLVALKAAGADRIGIAFDLATPGLFEELRGAKVGGPHSWDHYWEVFETAVSVFGVGHVGAHLIVGLGETEEDMVNAMARVRREGGCTHLFSFYPERGSAMEDCPQAEAPVYRRLQLARYLIDESLAVPENMAFDCKGRITGFGLETTALDKVIRSGKPFITSGCPGNDGVLACNRPYGDSPPGDDIRSYPFIPEAEDIQTIVRQLWTY